MHRMHSPIKQVRLLEFNFPINCKIFQDRSAIGQEYFNWALNIYEYKRVTATKYQKEEECFSIDIEEKNVYKEPTFDINSSEIQYYFDWVYSQGNKDGLILINAIKSMEKHISQKRKDSIILANIPKFTSHNRYYFQQLDTTTLKWIKEQPYFIRVQTLNKHLKDQSLSLIEESFSINYLKLLGLDTNNTDEIHSLLKKFKISGNFSTNDFLGSYCHREMLSEGHGDRRYQDYVNCGLQMPHVIVPNRSILIQNVENGEGLYVGHFVIWNETWSDFVGRFMKFYIVFVIDEKCKQES